MKNYSFFGRLALALVLILAMAAPAIAADNSAKSAKKPAASKTSKAKPAADTPEAVQAKLDQFAKTTIATLNRCVVPSAGKKAVTQNSDGTYTARYIEINPATLTTSYKKPENAGGPLTYIGTMRYEEIEYQCTASSKDGALNGPFAPKKREMMTELIKYINGKWTY